MVYINDKKENKEEVWTCTIHNKIKRRIMQLSTTIKGCIFTEYIKSCIQQNFQGK